MLVAIARGKTKFYRRYKGHRDEHDNGRVAAEDEITSMVFGPLCYLAAQDVAEFWRRLLSNAGNVGVFPDGVPDAAVVSFWPSKGYREDGGHRRVEPDMCIVFDWRSGLKFILLVEIKWNAPLSGDDQLQSQWKNFLSEMERKNSHHVFIGKNKTTADEGHRKLTAVSWRDVQVVLNDLPKGDTPVGTWSRFAADFLGKVIPRPFTGFHLPEIPLAQLKCSYFYRGKTEYFPCVPDGIQGALDGIAFYRK